MCQHNQSRDLAIILGTVLEGNRKQEWITTFPRLLLYYDDKHDFPMSEETITERQVRGGQCGRDELLGNVLFRHREVVIMYQELSDTVQIWYLTQVNN